MGPQLPAKPSLPLLCSLTQYQTKHLEGVCTPTVQKARMRGGGMWPPSDWSGAVKDNTHKISSRNYLWHLVMESPLTQTRVLSGG